MESPKPVHTLVLDAGAIIKNEPPVSSLLKQCESLMSVPEVISEIKDAATRSRFEVTLKPFLTLRSPNPASLRIVIDFARRTGDLAVLSKPDLQIIALTYEIECERNGGDWRLRRVPGQKGLNGAPPSKLINDVSEQVSSESFSVETSSSASPSGIEAEGVKSNATTAQETSFVVQDEPPDRDDLQEASDMNDSIFTQRVAQIDLNENGVEQLLDSSAKIDSAQNSGDSQSDSDSDQDPEGWITPSNLKKKQTEHAGATTVQSPELKVMQAAVLTSDFAMQNVILQMNLNLISPTLTRVKHLKTFVLRCHACFQTTKDMTKQFCPKCGQPSLTRVSCSTNANGKFKLHLKKHMQWNHRGDRYSIPKPVHGSANGKLKGGGKGGWGSELILAEDQKEYQKAKKEEKRQKARDVMDEDYLPGILSGDRGKGGGRVKVGAGRNVNSKKR